MGEKLATKQIYLLYGVLALLIMLPLLLPGYVFALDMVFGPEIRLPSLAHESFPLYAIFKLLSLVLPVQAVQKLILITIIIACGVGAHKLADFLQVKILKTKTKQRFSSSSAIYAGLLYTINPFTYARFMDGQLYVLMGYAILPYFAKVLFQFLFDGRQNLRLSLKLALVTWLMFTVSIHSVGYVLVLGVTALIVAIISYRKQLAVLIRILKFGTLSMLFVIMASSYWLIPSIRGDNSRTQMVQGFDRRHLLSFRTDGSSDSRVVGNVLSMYGYWGEREDRFMSPRRINPLWPVIVVMIISLALYGLYKYKNLPQVRSLAIASLIAVILAVGIVAEPFSYFNQWLVSSIPFFQGFREPQKFVALIVLAYACLGAAGINAMALERPWINKLFRNRSLSIHHFFIYAIVILPVLYTPTFLWGFANQLKSVQYPADWAQINDSYIKQAEGSTLFLPWHRYMYFDFAKKVIATPAPQFFSGHVIIGDNVEIGLIKRQSDSLEAAIIEPLLTGPDINRFGEKLTPLNVEYVLLAKTADWRNYLFLDQQSDMRLLSDTPGLRLYLNLAYKQKEISQ